MKENEIEINEKVRREVRRRIANARRYLDVGQLDNAAQESDALIIYILSAVCDGKQELLGEEGRFQQRRGKSVFREGTAMRLLWDGLLLIALRPEEASDAVLVS